MGRCLKLSTELDFIFHIRHVSIGDSIHHLWGNTGLNAWPLLPLNASIRSYNEHNVYFAVLATRSYCMSTIETDSVKND